MVSPRPARRYSVSTDPLHTVARVNAGCAREREGGAGRADSVMLMQSMVGGWKVAGEALPPRLNTAYTRGSRPFKRRLSAPRETPGMKARRLAAEVVFLRGIEQ